MTRRHVHRWAIWLLPLLLLRAFVPAGFMLSTDANGLSLVICSTATTLPAPASDHSAHHHHHGDESGSSVPSAATEEDERSALCPFALVGSACVHEVAFIAASPDPVEYKLLPESTLPGTLRPVRTDRIRGPPVLA